MCEWIHCQWGVAVREFFPGAERDGRICCALLLVAGLSVSWASAGCSGPQPQNVAGAALEAPSPVQHSIPRRVWVVPVEIEGVDEDTVEVTEDAFTLSFVRYLQQSRRFAEVRALPGKPGDDDWLLVLRFDRYQLMLIPRSTLLWFPGMPLFDEVTELDGKLEIRNANGDVLATASELIFRRRAIRGATLPSAAGSRTAFVEKVLSDALSQISQEEKLQ